MMNFWKRLFGKKDKKEQVKRFRSASVPVIKNHQDRMSQEELLGFELAINGNFPMAVVNLDDSDDSNYSSGNDDSSIMDNSSSQDYSGGNDDSSIMDNSSSQDYSGGNDDYSGGSNSDSSSSFGGDDN